MAKPEALPERPPTPEPEKEAFEATNIGAVTSNAETTQVSLPPKPSFSVATPPTADFLTNSLHRSFNHHLIRVLVIPIKVTLSSLRQALIK